MSSIRHGEADGLTLHRVTEAGEMEPIREVLLGLIGVVGLDIGHAVQRHERHVKRFFISVRGGGDEEIEVDTPKSRELMVDFLGKLVEKRRADLQPEAGTDDVVIDIGF